MHTNNKMNTHQLNEDINLADYKQNFCTLNFKGDVWLITSSGLPHRAVLFDNTSTIYNNYWNDMWGKSNTACDLKLTLSLHDWSRDQGCLADFFTRWTCILAFTFLCTIARKGNHHSFIAAAAPKCNIYDCSKHLSAVAWNLGVILN